MDEADLHLNKLKWQKKMNSSEAKNDSILCHAM